LLVWIPWNFYKEYQMDKYDEDNQQALYLELIQLNEQKDQDDQMENELI
jgi:hypothetical protein